MERPIFLQNESIRITNRIESIRIANWNALVITHSYYSCPLHPPACAVLALPSPLKLTGRNLHSRGERLTLTELPSEFMPRKCSISYRMLCRPCAVLRHFLNADLWVVTGEMGWTRAFHNTGWPHNSILRSTYSGHVRSGSLDS